MKFLVSSAALLYALVAWMVLPPPIYLVLLVAFGIYAFSGSDDDKKEG